MPIPDPPTSEGVPTNLLNRESEQTGDSSTSRSGPEKLPIEIGLVVGELLDTFDRPALTRAIERVTRILEKHLPEFDWQLLTVHRPELVTAAVVEPSDLLQSIAEDRDSRHWDFGILVTSADLAAHYEPYCHAAVSRPLDAAVVSTSLIDPLAAGSQTDAEQRIGLIECRLTRLILKAILHLAGVAIEHTFEEEDECAADRDSEATDIPFWLDAEQDQLLRKNLREVADLRLEERSEKNVSRIGFILRAAWINRREIASAIWSAKPWQFPLRLSRLTTAAISAVAIFLMTAEAWDLGLAQSPFNLFALSVVCLIVTISFVAAKQQLFIRRRSHPSEQIVVTMVSAIGIVTAGMIVIWCAMLCGALLLAGLLFNASTIAAWAASAIDGRNTVTWSTYLSMASFSASLGILIGALGASFESQRYFRHIIFVDEEF